MPCLRSGQCWQTFGSFDLGPALAVLDQIPFTERCMISADGVVRDPCFVAGRAAALPEAVAALVDEALAAIGGENRRFVFRKLAPRQGFAPHIDAIPSEEVDWRRFQLPLVTDPTIVMRWPEDGQELHLQAGILHEVRVDRLHEVINNADIERVHLQIDQVRATI